VIFYGVLVWLISLPGDTIASSMASVSFATMDFQEAIAALDSGDPEALNALMTDFIARWAVFTTITGGIMAVYWAAIWSRLLAAPYILARNLEDGPIAAFTTSWEATSGHWLPLAALVLVLQIASVVGQSMCALPSLLIEPLIALTEASVALALVPGLRRQG
jgi:hypothetical protein